jgi:hypothetical protein
MSYAGQRAIVTGTGNSGHDIPQDLYCNGDAYMTMVQRSSTCVVAECHPPLLPIVRLQINADLEELFPHCAPS